jgi:hypothetical protein
MKFYLTSVLCYNTKWYVVIFADSFPLTHGSTRSFLTTISTTPLNAIDLIYTYLSLALDFYARHL